jgi:hypothetical protein
MDQCALLLSLLPEPEGAEPSEVLFQVPVFGATVLPPVSPLFSDVIGCWVFGPIMDPF